MKSKYAWIKDLVIQVIFIFFAIIFTVNIAHSSISRHYAAYYESKLAVKAENLAHNAALVLGGQQAAVDSRAQLSALLRLLFSASDSGPETTRFALYDIDGKIVATNEQDPPVLPVEAHSGAYTALEDAAVCSYYLVSGDGVEQYVIAVRLNYHTFLAFQRDFEAGLYSALYSGCALMAVCYVSFSILTNLLKMRSRRKSGAEKAQTAVAATSAEKPAVSTRSVVGVAHISSFVRVHLISFFICAMIVGLCFFLFSNAQGLGRVAVIIAGGAALTVAAAHLLWFVACAVRWVSTRPFSGYEAQTLQFFIFLVIFLSIFSVSMQNGYNTQIELSRQDELRQTSIFTAVALSGGNAGGLGERAASLSYDEGSEFVFIIRTDAGFLIAGYENEDISASYDLLEAAWDGVSSRAGLRGGYMYGVTPIVGVNHETVALAGVRHSYAAYAGELQTRSIDFLLSMSATVLALVFLFVELNKLLEVINLADSKRERSLRYAPGARNLVFLVTLCQYIPMYFFVLIVHEIYRYNPVSWLPSGLASSIPLVLVLMTMLFGGKITAGLIKARPMAIMTLGCAIGAAGFMLMGAAVYLTFNFLLFIGMLVLTYTGVSMVYNGLWDHISYLSGIGDAGLKNLKMNARSGEYLGYTSGAVVGAIIYEEFGLMAALSFAGGVLLVLAALIRFMLFANEENIRENAVSGGTYGFIRFIQSKKIIVYTLMLIIPFAIAPYFTGQFSPLYAQSIGMSPGAASWTSLLQTVCIAYIAPMLTAPLLRRFKKSLVAAGSNILSAVALAIFALMPGIPTLYAAAALIGIAVGIGTDTNNDGFTDLQESRLYRGSAQYYNSAKSIFEQFGTVLFTVVHAISINGEYVLAVAALIAVLSVGYYIFSGRARAPVSNT